MECNPKASLSHRLLNYLGLHEKFTKSILNGNIAGQTNLPIRVNKTMNIDKVDVDKRHVMYV